MAEPHQGTNPLTPDAPMPLSAVPGALATFGGEDPIAGAAAAVPGSGWYHELITREGAVAAGWVGPAPGVAVGSTAADALAWHADYLDSYLYNPLWWFSPTTGGGAGRLGAALMARSELVKLHFDDLASTVQIRRMWQRYLGGTVAALVWAAEHDDVDAARNAIACGLHAMQDFYSHSTWVDAANRRAQTWFEAATPRLAEFPRPGIPVLRELDLIAPRALDPSVLIGRTVLVIRRDPRPGWELSTGTYELGPQHAVHVHGKYGFDCTVLTRLPAGLRNVAVPLLSFVGLEDLAARWRECSGDTSGPAPIPALAGVPAPPGILVLAPTGIALDNRWMSSISRGNRALDDANLTGDDLFATARALATRTTTQWLQELDRVGTTTLDPINPGFWNRVKQRARMGIGTPSSAAPNPESPADVRQFEDPAQQLFRLLAAGEYPPNPTGGDEAWWLRVTLGTSTVALSGTDADIVLEAGGQEFLLDYGRLRSQSGAWTENRLLEWNDFEAGSRCAYLVGPFAARPTAMTLHNRAASAGQLLSAAWNDFTTAVAAAVDAIGNLLLTLVGGHADLVGNGQRSWSWPALTAIATRGTPEQSFIYVDGGPEGRYRLEFDVMASWSGDNLLCRVTYRRLVCLEESDWDRFTSDDEPFVLTLVSAPAAGQTRSQILGPYAGVDTGETVVTSTAMPALVTVPRGTGLIVAIQVLESDDETAATRNQLLSDFASTFQTRTANPRSQLLDAVGTVLAPDWRIADVEAFAFRRGSVVEAGTVLPRTQVNSWLNAGSSRTFPFTQPPRASVGLQVS